VLTSGWARHWENHELLENMHRVVLSEFGVFNSTRALSNPIMDLLSLRLVGGVGARPNERNSYPG